MRCWLVKKVKVEFKKAFKFKMVHYRLFGHFKHVKNVSLHL